MANPFGNPPLCDCAEPMPCIVGAMGRRKAWACAKQPESAKCDFFQWVTENKAAPGGGTMAAMAANATMSRGASPSSSPEANHGPMKRVPSRIHASPRSSPYVGGSPSRASPSMGGLMLMKNILDFSYMIFSNDKDSCENRKRFYRIVMFCN